MSVKRKKRTNTLLQKNPTFYINILVVLFFLALSAILVKIFILDTINNDQETTKKVEKTSLKKQPIEDEHHKYEEKTNALEIEYAKGEEVVKSEKLTSKEKNTESEKKFSFFDEPLKQLKEEPIQVGEPLKNAKKDEINLKKQQQKEKEVVKENKTSKIVSQSKEKIVPKVASGTDFKRGRLAIIIDDVTTKAQFSKIQNIGFPITMAFLPPTSIHKDSAKLAQSLTLYMVHLPLEATSKRAEETNTLHVGDDLSTIEERIKELKSLYPNALYYNNHTGSKFTEDDESMDKLMKVIKENHLIFVDSRTSSKSVVKKYATKYGVKYMGRNVFLDNRPSKEYIKNQLLKAIEISKSSGSAIAIGHPYSATIDALKESKNLLDGVDIVLIDKI